MFRGCLCAILLCLSSIGHAHTIDTITKDAEWRLKIPGSYYFDHCKCFSHYLMPTHRLAWMDLHPFPDDTSEHPISPQDILWHRFMQGILKARTKSTYTTNEATFKSLVSDNGTCFVCHLSQYLNVIHRFKTILEQERIRSIKSWRSIYTRPKEANDLKMKIEWVNECTDAAIRILNDLPIQLVPLYSHVLDGCKDPTNDNMALLYNFGLVSLVKGDYETALSKISRFIDLADRAAYRDLLKSEVFQFQGESYFEVGLYHNAIDALTTSIKKDPDNKRAYFSRAAAYFEAGAFESSLKDFLSSGITPKQYYNPRPVSRNFLEEFTMSLGEGTVEGCIEFVPNLCHTACGLGRVLWDCAQAPIESVELFAGACLDAGEWFVDYCKTLDQEKIEGYVDDLKTLYARFDELSEGEKGRLIGHTIGKHGVDILGGAVLVEGVLALKGAEKASRLREINRACTMEAMASSPAVEEKIIQAATQHAVQRDAYFQSAKVHWDSHHKHVPGHPFYESNRSIITHPDPELLLRRGAGTGHGLRGSPGKPGYKEEVEFGEIIGIWKSKDQSLQLPTTRGTIHYRKNGLAHIVPAPPHPGS